MNFLIALVVAAHAYPISWKSTPFKGSVLVSTNAAGKHGSVVILHGSEGGSAPYIDSEASLIAAMGYNVLEYCYFDCNRGLTGVRATLKNVEVNGLLQAVAWLRKQPSSNGKVAVYGFSRGAEFALIAASQPNKIDAVIAHSPSDIFNGAWNWSWREPACWITPSQWNTACGPDSPAKVDNKESAWLIGGRPIATGRRIEIENFTKPILITVGEADEVWPVDQTRRIEATLKAHARPLEIHYTPKAGHVFLGENEARRRDQVLAFLKRTL